jgi:hypothetical protein
MSFTGAGPLGDLGWGTNACQALKAQEKDIENKYNQLQNAIKNKEVEFASQPFPSLSSSTKPGISPYSFESFLFTNYKNLQTNLIIIL